jgi:cell division protein FtsL
MTTVSAPRARGRTQPVRRSGTQPVRRSGTQPVRRSGTQPVRRSGTQPVRPIRRADGRARAHRPARTAAGLRAGIGVFVAAAAVFVLVSAVLFHVVLAQGQLELDRLDARISAERQEYEQRRLETSTLASPQRIQEEAERQGLVKPDGPPVYLYVEGAPLPAADDARGTATTLRDWEKVKPSLGDNRP